MSRIRRGTQGWRVLRAVILRSSKKRILSLAFWSAAVLRRFGKTGAAEKKSGRALQHSKKFVQIGSP